MESYTGTTRYANSGAPGQRPFPYVVQLEEGDNCFVPLDHPNVIRSMDGAEEVSWNARTQAMEVAALVRARRLDPLRPRVVARREDRGRDMTPSPCLAWLLQSVEGESLVKTFAQTRMRREHFTEMSAQLDLCQKALAEHREEKRSITNKAESAYGTP